MPPDEGRRARPEKPLDQARPPSAAPAKHATPRRVSATQRAVFRRRRAGALGVLVVIGAVVYGIVAALSSSTPPARHGVTRKRSALTSHRPAPASSRRPTAPPDVLTGLFAWHLPNPIGGEVIVTTRQPHQLLLAGGVSAAGTTDDGVYSLLSTNGSLVPLSNLPAATENAAGAMLGGELVVLGGGEATPTAGVQGFNGTSSSLIGSLPQPRADAGSVTIDGTDYVVGGYSGGSMDAEVLATTDGTTFTDVAALPVPVRYPAVAARGTSIYLFGGLASGGAPVDTVQVVNTLTRRARIVGHLPTPLSGAVAVDLGASIYVAGGLRGTSAATVTSEVLGYEPAGKRFVRAGSLAVAVSDAGAAVTGGELVIVGGETSAGVLTGDAQFVRREGSGR